MRTDLQGAIDVENVSRENLTKGKSASDGKIKGLRRSLQPLQKAGNSDKLVGAGRTPESMKGCKEKLKTSDIYTDETSEVGEGSSKKKKPATREILIKDLTSEEGPSENYWEIIAERRRIALSETLEENKALHNRIALLEEEKRLAEAMLEEAGVIIESLTEAINEKEKLTSEGNENLNQSDEEDN